MLRLTLEHVGAEEVMKETAFSVKVLLWLYFRKNFPCSSKGG